MPTLTNKLRSTKNFVIRHRTPLLCVATAVATATVMGNAQGNAAKSLAEFIEDKGLMDEYVALHPIIVK